MKGGQLGFKFFCCDIYIVNLDIKVLACTERVVFLLDVLIRDGDRKILDSFFLDKGLDDLLLFLGDSTVFWFLPSLTLVPRFEASMRTTSPLFFLSIKRMETLVPVVAKILDGIDTTPASI